MNHRIGSNINSPLFMIDPTTPTSSKKSASTTFTLKSGTPFDNPSNPHSQSNPNESSNDGRGELRPTNFTTTDPLQKRPQNFSNSDNSASFVHSTNSSNPNSDDSHNSNVSDSNREVFIIDGDDGSFELHRDTLKLTLQDLKSQCHVNIRNLTGDHSESFKNVVDVLRILHSSPDMYQLIVTDIRNIFSDVQNIKPATVGAFFIGCFDNTGFPGPVGCNPKCAASFIHGADDHNDCSELVLIYSDGSFSSLNEKNSELAHIYIEDNNFKGFSAENINQLKEADIKEVSLIYGNPNGSLREVTGVIAVENLPLNSDSTDVNNDANGESTDASSGASIAFWILLIIFIIVLLFLVYRNGI